LAEAVDLGKTFASAFSNVRRRRSCTLPAFVSLTAVQAAIKARAWALVRKTCIGKSRALTPQISAAMLTGLCTHVIIRPLRTPPVFGETDGTVNKKVKPPLAADLIPIVCVGETLADTKRPNAEVVSVRPRCLRRH